MFSNLLVINKYYTTGGDDPQVAETQGRLGDLHGLGRPLLLAVPAAGAQEDHRVQKRRAGSAPPAPAQPEDRSDLRDGARRPERDVPDARPQNVHAGGPAGNYLSSSIEASGK